MWQRLKRFYRNYRFLIFIVLFLWFILLVSYLLPINNLGIRPRSIYGLPGILISPFLHQGFSHLIANSMSILLLGIFLSGLEAERTPGILAALTLLSGAGTWVIGRGNAIHIGASGVIYGMLGYLISTGFFNRSMKTVVVSLLILLLYGGAVWGVLPAGNFISWESHLSGFISGIIVARLYSKRGRKR
jgi:membrane associated rhomboid family serine protease